MDTVAGLKLQYAETSQAIESILSRHKLEESAKTMALWREEIASTESFASLCQKASRTMRSFAGMESIGEFAISTDNRELMGLIDRLYSICKLLCSLAVETH
jgi:hypothetical protein